MSGFIRVAGIVVLYTAIVFFLLGLGDYRGIEVLTVLGLPVLLSSWFFGLIGGAISGIASLIFSVPFVPDSKVLPIAGLCYLAVGGGVELWHRLKHPPKTNKRSPHEHQLFQRSLNLAHIIDAEGHVWESN